MSTQVLPEYICPITQECMTSPVIGSDGHSYEEAAIRQWLISNSRSPMTREHMSATSLRPNHALRNSIERYLSTAPVSTLQNDVTSQFAFKPLPIDVTANIHMHNGAPVMHVHLKSPSVGERQPIALIAMIDTSGSMGEGASMGIGTEAHGFTRLDLVKHSVNTIASILNERDSLTIITFSTAARIQVPPTQMTLQGKEIIKRALTTIMPDESTNIWDGIRLGAQVANRPELAGRNIIGMLLTDGFPNINPPRGIMNTLQSIKMVNAWSLHTFGVGYNLDSQLLADIATWGNGMFGFIPDCSMVGTVIINFLANMLSTANPNMTLSYKVGNAPAVTINTGAILIGQDREIVIKLPGSAVQFSTTGALFNPVTITEDPLDTYTAVYSDYMDVLDIAIREGSNANKSHGLDKARYISAATAALVNFESARNTAIVTDDRVKALLRDICSSNESEGQVGMAPMHIAKWGEHYLRSYLKAQKYQQSMNFKDPGLQIYGGELFHQIQEEGDRIFCELEPPKSTAASANSYTNANANSVAALIAPVNMAHFHNASGGCFQGDCIVKMADGTLKKIQDTQAGEQVWTPTGAATIRAVVICGTYARSQPMSQIGKLCITPWHPIRIEGVWQFPADVVSYTSRLISTVYNFVLDCGHIVDVEGIQCVTLGHGFQEDKVCHAFFGTDAVITDIKCQPGWGIGRPVFKNLVTTRNLSTGMINGWVDVI